MMSIILTSSALILFLIALRRLLRGRISPTVQYALWLLVAARLLIPGTLFTAPVSLMGAAQELQTTIQAALPDEGGLPAYVLPPITDTPPEVTPPPQTDFYGETHTVYPPSQNTIRTPVPLSDWMDVIWKAGIALVGTAFLLSDLAFYRNLRKKRRLLPSEELPTACKASVYVVEGLSSPCLVGLIRPAIYLNEEALAQDRLVHILTHEDTHRRHGDHLWAALRSICLAIHWYNPLVWWAAALSRRDCELSCDEAAIHRLGEESRISYGQTLLAMILPRTSPADLLRTATTMTAGKRTMAERIQLIARQPKTTKIALAVVVVAALAVVVFVFGGAAEDPPQDDASGDTPGVTLPDISPDGEQVAPSAPLTEKQALAIYDQARKIWDWFELGTLPTTDGVLQDESGSLLRVADYDSLEQLRSHLEQYFTPSLADHLLMDFMTFRESDGGLYVQSAGRGSSIYAGKENVTAFVLTGKDAAQQGHDCHIYATTEVLDFYEPEAILYERRHDWFMAWNGRNYVFTTFGPWDDVDPQKYYNALTILDHYNRGNTITTWYPMLACLDWNALRATEELWPEGFDLGMYVIDSISQYITQYGADMTAVQYLDILSATEGLDGAYSEGFSHEVYRLYENDPGLFAYAVTEGLSLNDQIRAVDMLRSEEVMRGIRTTPMTREETYSMLRDALGQSVSAAPAEMHFDQPGQQEQFLPVNAYGISAASYTSSDTAVATVDDLGFVTAVGLGKATITLHYEGVSGQKDFTCAVTCDWEAESAATTLYTHSSSFFSLALPAANCKVTETPTGINIKMDDESWTLRLLTQPSQWLDEHPSQALMLSTFNTNGTPQTYLLEAENTNAPLTRQIADSFRLHVTADTISRLVHENFESDMARTIQYLPYLSWQNYREQYGTYKTGGLQDLLSALRNAADSGDLSWAQYHDLLSALPDGAIDDTLAPLYRETLQTLHDNDPRQFASVLLSDFISPAEQESALAWLDMDLQTLKAENA